MRRITGCAVVWVHHRHRLQWDVLRMSCVAQSPGEDWLHHPLRVRAVMGLAGMITISDEFGSLALSVDGDDLVVAAKKRSAVKTKVDVLTLPVPSLLDGSDGVAVGMEVVPGPSAGDRTNTDRPAGGRVRPASAGAGRPKASPAATATGGVSTGGDSPPGDIPLHSLHVRGTGNQRRAFAY